MQPTTNTIRPFGDCCGDGAESFCPGCGSQGLSIFYEQAGIPVDSCRLVKSLYEAKRFPQGFVCLGFCRACGLVTNMAFDPSIQDCSASYEEFQGYSPRFRAFTEDLARRLIEKYALKGRDLFEIGCGKGEFLAMMCGLGGNRGIGVDPCFLEKDFQRLDVDGLSFIKDYFSERYAHLMGDFVICRHTLEHIKPVGSFMRLLRRCLGNRTDTVVFLEVPDTARILKEAAFWDVYYEHCSYFSCGSLARLCRATGFEVLDMELDFGDQYILMECRPTGTGQKREHTLEESPHEFAQMVEEFHGELDRARLHWKNLMRRELNAGRRVVIWGSASKGAAFLRMLGLEDEIKYIVNINHHQQGMYVVGTGQKIVPPEFLKIYNPDVVVVMNPIYFKEIRQSLDEMGVSCKILSASNGHL